MGLAGAAGKFPPLVGLPRRIGNNGSDRYRFPLDFQIWKYCGNGFLEHACRYPVGLRGAIFVLTDTTQPERSRTHDEGNARHRRGAAPGARGAAVDLRRAEGKTLRPTHTPGCGPHADGVRFGANDSYRSEASLPPFPAAATDGWSLGMAHFLVRSAAHARSKIRACDPGGPEPSGPCEENRVFVADPAGLQSVARCAPPFQLRVRHLGDFAYRFGPVHGLPDIGCSGNG